MMKYDLKKLNSKAIDDWWRDTHVLSMRFNDDWVLLSSNLFVNLWILYYKISYS